MDFAEADRACRCKFFLFLAGDVKQWAIIKASLENLPCCGYRGCHTLDDRVVRAVDQASSRNKYHELIQLCSKHYP